jgi:hypothetical protein
LNLEPRQSRIEPFSFKKIIESFLVKTVYFQIFFLSLHQKACHEVDLSKFADVTNDIADR